MRDMWRCARERDRNWFASLSAGQALVLAAAVIVATLLVVSTPGCGEGGDAATTGGAGAGAGTQEVDPDEEVNSGIDPDVVAQLRALGYVDLVEDISHLDKLGLTINDAPRVADGLRFFTNVHNCSSQLISTDGRLLHEWKLTPCHKWGNSVLARDGSVFTIHWNPVAEETAATLPNARELVKIGWDGEVEWRRALPVHHDLDIRPDGSLAVLTYEHRLIKGVNPTVPVRDDDIVILTPDGELMESASITDLLLAGPDGIRFEDVGTRFKDGMNEVDLLHANSIEWMYRPELAEQDPLYDLDNVLVCVRNQDLVAIFDWSEQRVLWTWGRGKLVGPHDATLLDNGNVLVFDNGLGRKWSRIIEMDPRTGKVVWRYTAPERTDFYTAQRGACERLANGNTLITESAKGRMFEVTTDGEIVWEFLNPNLSEEGLPIVVVRIRRVAELGEESVVDGGPPVFGRSD